MLCFVPIILADTKKFHVKLEWPLEPESQSHYLHDMRINLKLSIAPHFRFVSRFTVDMHI